VRFYLIGAGQSPEAAMGPTNRIASNGPRRSVGPQPIAALLATALCAATCGCGGDGSRDLLEAEQPRAITTIATQPRARVALVLSSGGLRGLAHLGVLRVLEAEGLKPDLVVGASVGAIVGVGYAAGLQVEQLLGRPLPGLLDPWGTWLVSPTQRARSLEAFIADAVAGQRIEGLPRRFVAVATERNTGCIVLFGAGDAARAVAASSALPGALAPVSIAGRSFVDGSLAAPLPVRVARALGAERVIAVDTTFHAETEVPDGVIDSVFHAGMVMSRHLAIPDRESADVLIEPRLPPVSEVTLANRAQLALAGERAAMAQIQRLRRLFSSHDLPVRVAGAAAELPMCDATLGRWADLPSARHDADAPPVTALP
jgi:NTE family protein